VTCRVMIQYHDVGVVVAAVVAVVVVVVAGKVI
jgi:hypothetical protein